MIGMNFGCPRGGEWISRCKRWALFSKDRQHLHMLVGNRDEAADITVAG